MIKQTLPEIAIFQGLNKLQIEDLSAWLQRREHPPGVTIVKENDPADGLFVLAKGVVSVFKQTPHGPLELARLQGPTVFGELGILSREPCSASIRSETDVIVGWLPVDVFEKQIGLDNRTAYHIAYNLGRIASHRMRAALERIVELNEALKSQAPTAENMRSVSCRLTQLCQDALTRNTPQ